MIMDNSCAVGSITQNLGDTTGFLVQCVDLNINPQYDIGMALRIQFG